MQKVLLGNLGAVIRGLLDGSLQITISATGKTRSAPRGRPKSVSKKATRVSPPKSKPGRPRLPESLKRKKAERAKAAKSKALRKALPTPRDLLLFMVDQRDGLKPSALAKHFGASRVAMKPFLARLLAKGDLTELRGRLFLKRRVRIPGRPREKGPEPIPETVVLEYLAKNGPSTLSAMASAMNEPSFHRLIRVTNALKKAGKVIPEGKTYRLA